VVPKSRLTTKAGLVFAATLRDGANFPGLVAARRSKMPDILRSLLLDPEKIGYRRCRPNSVNRPYAGLGASFLRDRFPSRSGKTPANKPMAGKKAHTW
jgi:hypothetical protein